MTQPTFAERATFSPRAGRDDLLSRTKCLTASTSKVAGALVCFPIGEQHGRWNEVEGRLAPIELLHKSLVLVV